MTEGATGSGVPDSAITVCVRVRPLNPRELGEGHRVCVSFDEPSKQVVLTAVDKNTLLQLRGSGAKGYAFDRRYGQEEISDAIYDDVVSQLVESCFKGYNATVLAYGQTGSGKTHTMSGGVGIHMKQEEGIIPRVIRHLWSICDAIRKKNKPGEKCDITACALELYNEDLLDLSVRAGSVDANKGWDGVKKEGAPAALKLQERPVGKEGRVVPEVIGVREIDVSNASDLKRFFDDCMVNRSTSSTKLNDRSSRSHALFTITVHRTIVEVMDELGEDFRAKIRTSSFSSKLHLVDLAGSERVKRSGVTGKELKEATHINSGLLALGNVIVALSKESENKTDKKGHVPYRDSKLTRLLQDSLGGNSLTLLISCISPSEQDFEETNNTLKYANRACNIKNTPLPNKFTMLEEDLLPTLPMGAPGMGLGLVGLQSLLEDHERMKEHREKKQKEKLEKEARKQAALAEMRDEDVKKPGFQRLRATQYDELRRQLTGKGGSNIPTDQVIGDDTLAGFGRMNLAKSVDMGTPSSGGAPGSARRISKTVGKSNTARRGSPSMTQSMKVSSAGKPADQTFADWLASQEAAGEVAAAGAVVEAADAPYVGKASVPEIVDDDFFDRGDEHQDSGLIEESPGSNGVLIEDDDEGNAALIIEDDDDEVVVMVGVDDDDDAVKGVERSSGDGNGQGDVAAEAVIAGGVTAAAVASSDDAGDSAAVVAAAAAPAVLPAATGPKSKFKRGPVAALEEDAASVGASGSMASFADSNMAVQGSDMGQEGDLPDMLEIEDGDEVEIEDEGDEVVLVDDEAALDEEDEEEEDLYDPIEDNATPKLLARFKVNQADVLSVFKASSKEDFEDVICLLPENTPLPASDRMTYLLARLENPTAGHDINAALARVSSGDCSMNEAVGPAVGCLMATFGTNMISSCIFEFEDPADLKYFSVEERIELWGLQIPHNSVRPTLAHEEGGPDVPKDDAAAKEAKEAATITWSSVDRLNMSIGLLYALCNYARAQSIRCGFCVPRPQLLRRWLQAGVRMKQITSALKLIYPSSAHDYEYYKASTVAFFMIHEVREALEKVLAIVPVSGADV